MVNTSKQRFKYKHTVPQFDPNDEQFAYWIGFLLADGCVKDEAVGSDRLIVGLNKKDRRQLVKLRKWLKSDHPIADRPKYHSVDLRIRSQPLCDMLREFGIIPRKSLVAIPDYRLENNRHFWRGVVDGDGTIFIDSRDKLLTLGLLGTKDVCQKFWKFCYNIDQSFRLVSVCKASWNGYSVRTCGKRAKKIIEELYRDATVYLDRKKKFVEENIS